MLVGTIRCQHWCSDCCGLAEYERVWQSKCASYLSEKHCLCSKLSAWSHSNFVCLSTLNLSSWRILSCRCLVQTESISDLFCQPFPGERSILPAVERWRMLTGGTNSSTACVGLLHQRAAPIRCHQDVQTCSSHSCNSLAGWLLVLSLGMQRSPAAASVRGDATLVVLGNSLRTWARGIKIILFDLKVFSCCRTFLSTVLVGEPLHGDYSELCFWLNRITWHLHFTICLKCFIL